MPEMEHPNLPGRLITVTERAVHLHELAGWVRRARGDMAEAGEQARKAGEELAATIRDLADKVSNPTPESSPAEPVNTEQASDPLDLTKEI